MRKACWNSDKQKKKCNIMHINKNKAALKIFSKKVTEPLNCIYIQI